MRIRDRKIRIIKTKYYTIENRAGQTVIVTGYKAANEKPYVIDIFNPAFIAGSPVFRLHDGHLPECCPITASIRKALDFLDLNRFSEVTVIESTNI